MHVVREVEIAKVLIERGGNPVELLLFNKDHEGSLPLHDAAMSAETQVLNLYITVMGRVRASGKAPAALGAELHRFADVRNNLEMTPVLTAVAAGKMENAKLLVAGDQGDGPTSGGSTESIDSHGRGVLHFACIAGRVDQLLWLLYERKSPVNLRDSEGRLPLFYANKYGHTECEKWLKEAGSEPLDVVSRLSNWFKF